jgi:uncharacterized protein (DUF362 family)
MRECTRRELLKVAAAVGASAAAGTALAACGDAAGDDVVLKPNTCTGYHGPEYAAATNPDVVGQLVRLCRAAGAARVRVMDSPFGSSAAEAYSTSGIKTAVEKAGGVIQLMAPARFRSYHIPEGRAIKEWPIYEDVLSCDVLIDVPIAKDRGLTRLTLGGKHLLPLPRADANGPTGGDLADVKKLDTVIAGRDMAAADSYAATLLDLSGADIPYVSAAAAMGLGEIDLHRVDGRTANV